MKLTPETRAEKVKRIAERISRTWTLSYEGTPLEGTKLKYTSPQALAELLVEMMEGDG